MKKYMIKKDAVIGILSLLFFFSIETFFYNEILLLVIIIAFMVSRFVSHKGRDLRLFSVGTVLGFVIEWYMGNFSRTQHWNNTLYFSIPIWLPFAWGFGFEVIHIIGKALDSGNDSD
jgi:hypothetical protein